jgi:hypothetical protein
MGDSFLFYKFDAKFFGSNSRLNQDHTFLNDVELSLQS